MEILGCSIEKFPMKYLGLPVKGNPRSESFWKPVVDKIGKRLLEDWKRALLSKRGRYTLIQSILSGIPIYFLSLFKVPIRVAKSIESIMSDFLWKGKDGGKKMHLVRWEIVSLSKDKGGLALGNIVARNLALLGKWLWRIPLESDSLWFSIIKSKYGVHDDARSIHVVLRGNCHSPWKSISHGFPLFSRFLSIRVGNGESIWFWEDIWVGNSPFAKDFPGLYKVVNSHGFSITLLACSSLGPIAWNLSFTRNLTEKE